MCAAGTGGALLPTLRHCLLCCAVLRRSVLAPYTQGLPGGGRVMPSRSQLEAAGRHDVVRLVVRAGGFLEVAQVCLAIFLFIFFIYYLFL